MTLVTPPGLVPGGETVERHIPGVGLVRFENYPPGGWMTKAGAPAKKSRRRYLLDGEEIDSVSSIVDTLHKEALLRWVEDHSCRGAVQAERMGELAGVPEEDFHRRVKALGLGSSAKRDEGADRGTIIHAAMHGLTQGIVPNPADVPGIARPWVQGAMRAWLALGFEPENVLEAEQIVANPVLRYGGRPDLVAVAEKKVTLLDYKSSRNGRTFDSCHFQTRLYALALAECGVDVERIVIVGIGNDGGFELTECACSADAAEALVRVHRARKAINSDTTAQRRIAKAAA